MSLEITTYIAIYGAVLGTIGTILSIILAIREFKKEKRTFKVILEFVAFYERYRVRIVNTGFRKITVVSIGATVFKKTQKGLEAIENIPSTSLLEKDDALPITLDDGENIVIDLQPIVSQFYANESEVIRVFAHDAEGRLFTQTEERVYNPKYYTYDG